MHHLDGYYLCRGNGDNIKCRRWVVLNVRPIDGIFC